MRRSIWILAGSFLIISMIFVACSKGGGNKPEPGDSNFDKTAMLTYIADQMIIPAYASYQQKINSLQTAINAFADAPSVTTQAAAALALKAAQLQYQNIEVFNNLTPASSVSLEYYTNFFGGLTSTDISLDGFSVDQVTIESNISTGVYNFTEYTNKSFYAQGFPALGYLVAAPDAVTKFGTNAVARTKYIKDVTLRMKTQADKMVTDWTIYRASFIGNTQSNVGSPIGNLVNGMAYEIDVLKGPRIGWPFGKQSNGQVFATKVEGYNTQNSVALALANLKNLKALYTSAGNGKGFSDYLNSLGKQTLNGSITAQFDTAIAKLEAIPDPLSTSLTTQATVVNAAYIEIQKLLTLIKTDMSSALGVQISFMDSDGD
uniref:imelysin family protein n=1 Tax=Pedobacter schmidteae TaxID=2201271 RepID=UPI000EAF6D1D|nr:imelysin family protein [Pedobacter schmidteae]